MAHSGTVMTCVLIAAGAGAGAARAQSRPVAKVEALSPPAFATTGEAFQLQFRLLDDRGNPTNATLQLSSPTARVTWLTPGSTPEVFATSQVTSAGGFVTFDRVWLRGPLGQHTVRAQVVGGDKSADVVIELRAGAVTQLIVLRQPKATFRSDVPLDSIRVRAVDMDGHPLPGIELGVSLCGAAAETTAALRDLAGTWIRKTGDDGVAVFDDLVLSGLGGRYQLMVHALGTSRTRTPDPVSATTCPAEASGAVQAKLRTLTYDPIYEYDRSWVIIAAIKSITGAPASEFFDLRFRFRLSRLFFTLAGGDLSLSNRADTAKIASSTKELTEAFVTVNLSVARAHRNHEKRDVPTRVFYTGAQLRIFNTVPYAGVQIGSVELGGSPFHGSSASLALIRPFSREPVVVDDETVLPREWNLFAEFYVRADHVDFFKHLAVRGGVLIPLDRGARPAARIAIEVPIGAPFSF